MINQFKGYSETKSYGEYRQLPKGGYVLVCMGAKIKEGQYGQYIEISFDIAKGQYKDFFREDYVNQNREDKKWRCNYLLNIPTDDGSEKDGWTKRRFKTFTEALEDSNNGYHFDWDETKFKNKMVGGLFVSKEYRDSTGLIQEFTALRSFTSVAKIEANDYKLPKDITLDRNRPAEAIETPEAPAADSVPDIKSEDLPF
jgi:hypothetical protein